MRPETTRVVNVPKPVFYTVELCELRVKIDPKLTAEDWVKKTQTVFTYSHTDFTNQRLEKFRHTKDGVVTEASVTCFRVGTGKDYSIPWAQRMRNALNLLPVGFEHMAAIVCQHTHIWHTYESRWLFSPDLLIPDIQRSDKSDAPVMVGIMGDYSLQQFSVTTHDSFEGHVWFCGLKKATE